MRYDPSANPPLSGERDSLDRRAKIASSKRAASSHWQSVGTSPPERGRWWEGVVSTAANLWVGGGDPSPNPPLSGEGDSLVRRAKIASRKRAVRSHWQSVGTPPPERGRWEGVEQPIA